MTPLGDPRKHLLLISGAAKITGVDLARAMQEGRLTHEDWTAAVTRCRGCSEPGACARWLAEIAPAPDLPGYCRNVETLDALREA